MNWSDLLHIWDIWNEKYWKKKNKAQPINFRHRFLRENHYTGNTHMAKMTCQYMTYFMKSIQTQIKEWVHERLSGQTFQTKKKKNSTFKKKKVVRQLVWKQKKEGEKNKNLLVEEKREKERKRREEDCWAGAILDVICLLGDGAPALKSPLGARIVWEEPAIFCSIIYHCHHIMIPLAAPYWCL